MNNKQQGAQYSQHPSISNLFINQQDKLIVKEFSETSDINLENRKKLVELQQLYGNEHSQYALGIKSIQKKKYCKKIIVTYNCDQSAIPLSQIIIPQVSPILPQSQDKYKIPKLQIQIFRNLYEIYGFLNTKNIQHRNLKPNNIILYNNQLFLMDFCHIEGEWFTDLINFFDQQNNSHHRNNTYPYLSPEIQGMITQYKQTQFEDQNALQNRDQLSVKKQDQFAIAIMMLEVFKTLENRDLTSVEIRQKEINELIISEFTEEDEKFIKNTISGLLKLSEFNEKDYNDNLNKIEQIEKQLDNYQINKQALMNQNYKNFVKWLLKYKKYNFDLKLFCFFTKEELQNLSIQNESSKELKDEIKKFIKIYNDIDNGRLNNSQYDSMGLKEDDLQLISLVYLDDQIQSLQKSKSIMSEKLLQYHILKRQLRRNYDQINKMQQSDFTFNTIQQADIQINENENNLQPQNLNNMQNQNLQQADIQINQNENENENNLQQQNLNNMQNQNLQQADIHINQNQSNLQPCIINNIQNQNLKRYYQLFRCIRQNIDNIYQCQGNSNDIYIGKFENNNIFTGEIIQLEEEKRKDKQEEKVVLIKHFFKITLDNMEINSVKVQNPESQIIYFKESKHLGNFNKIIEYIGEIKNGKKNGKGVEKNFIKNMSYNGTWENDQMLGDGTKEIINTEFTPLNSPYKWKGTFVNSQLNGDEIKTYLLHSKREIWLEGRYQNDYKIGNHICYEKKQGIDRNPVLYKAYYVNCFQKEYSFCWQNNSRCC